MNDMMREKQALTEEGQGGSQVARKLALKWSMDLAMGRYGLHF